MNITKRDWYWTIAMAGVILLCIVTYWLGGKGNEIVSYIIFASALISIILALVAIFYSIVQNVSSQQNIGEMKVLISEASRIMTEKTDALEFSVELHNQDNVIMKETTLPATPVGDIDVFTPFSLKVTSQLARLFVIFLLKSYNLDKSLPVKKFVNIVKPLAKMSINEFSYHTYGILFGIACCLQVEMNDEKTEVKLVNIPDNFETHLGHHIFWMNKNNPELTEYIEQINNIL